MPRPLMLSFVLRRELTSATLGNTGIFALFCARHICRPYFLQVLPWVCPHSAAPRARAPPAPPRHFVSNHLDRCGLGNHDPLGVSELSLTVTFIFRLMVLQTPAHDLPLTLNAGATV